MKKIISLCLCIAMAVSCMACAGKTEEPAEVKETVQEEAEAEQEVEAEQEEASADPIFIPILGPLTGNNAFSGQELFNGAELRINQYNEAGGYHGRMIETEIYDTKAEPNEGATIAQMLASDQDVFVTIGPWSSTVAMAMAPIMDKAEKILYATSAGHIDLTGMSEWVVRQTPISPNISKGMAEGTIERGLTNCAYVYDNTNEGCVNSADSFKEYYEPLGGTVILDGYQAGTKDFTPLITKYKQMGIDSVMIQGSTADVGLFVTQARDLELDCLIAMASMSVNEQLYPIIEGCEEIYLVDSYAADYPSEAMKQFVNDYVEAYGSVPTVHAYFAYTACDHLFLGFEKCGVDDIEALREYLRNDPAYESPLGTLGYVDGTAERSMIWQKFNGTDAFETIK